jgi:hypothetical protein
MQTLEYVKSCVQFARQARRDARRAKAARCWLQAFELNKKCASWLNEAREVKQYGIHGKPENVYNPADSLNF